MVTIFVNSNFQASTNRIKIMKNFNAKPRYQVSDTKLRLVFIGSFTAIGS